MRCEYVNNYCGTKFIQIGLTGIICKFVLK